MTVDAQSVVEGPFAPNGVTTAWPFTFTADDDSEVVAVRLSPFGALTEVGGDVERDADGGGVVTITPALPTAGGALYILFVPSFGQTTLFEHQGAFSARVMNAALDRAALRDQYLKGMLDRAVLAPLGSDGLDAGGIIGAIEDARDGSLAQVMGSVQDYVQANLNLADETQDWIAACALAGSPPTIGRALLMDKVIGKLKAAGAFSTWGLGVFAVGETLAQTLVNIIDPGTAASHAGGGALEFSADRYLKSDGAAYVDTGLAVPGARFTRDSAFILVRQMDDVDAGANRLAGTQGGRAYVVPCNNDHVRCQANTMTQVDSAAFITNGAGSYGWVRRDEEAFIFLVGGAPFEVIREYQTGDPVREAELEANQYEALTPAAGHFQLLKSGAQVSSGRLGWAVTGLAPSDAQIAAANEAMEFYLREIGAAA